MPNFACTYLGVVRRDPMAMLPFCGYNMDSYFHHWLKMGEKAGLKAPLIFGVNWFRKNAQGKFAWPGFGENARVLEWIFGRIMGEAQAVETPVGLMPTYKDLNWEGLPHFSEEQFKELTSLDANKWETELASSAEFFAKFDGSIPEAFAVIQDDILKDFSSLKTPKTKTILTELSP